MLTMNGDKDKDIEMGPAAGSEGVGLVLDFDPQFASIKSHTAPLSLEWRNIKYTVGKGKSKKEILHTISGRVDSGNVVAIMGPSGAGKTTLLNVLAGRITNKSGRRLEGELVVNGKVTSSSVFRKRIAYVTQDDALFATATARESLEFSALLRLPSSTTAQERKVLVQDMLDSLGLTKVQNTMVGSASIRGLSGGERKRVAVGVELVSNPAVLFLDEPSSGLDSVSAWKVLRILNAIAAKGALVLCSIHQPSSEVFREFSHLVLLGSGNIIFQGELRDVDGVFRAKGLGVPPHTNIADHFMLCTQTKTQEELPQDNGNTRIVRKRVSEDDEGHMDLKVPEKRRGYLVSSWALALREFRGVYRDKAGLIGRFGGTAFLNILFAVIFMHAGDQSREKYSTQTHFGAVVQIFISALFGAAQPAILTFPLERVIFLRERATNTYSTFPYVLSKLIVELPLNFATAVVTMLISYWAMDLSGNFFAFVGSILLLMEAAVSTAYLIGSLASDAKSALELAPIILVPQILFLGFFTRIDQLPIWLQWVQWIVATKFGLNLACLTEFTQSRCSTPEICEQFEQLLESNDVKPSLTWLYIVILFAIFFVFRFIALVLLNERAKNFES